MGVASGYCLHVWCDKCEKAGIYDIMDNEFTDDGPYPKTACYRQARAMGWSVGRERALCPIHSGMDLPAAVFDTIWEAYSKGMQKNGYSTHPEGLRAAAYALGSKLKPLKIRSSQKDGKMQVNYVEVN